MARIAAPRFPLGLDDDPVDVERAVISSKAKTIADAIHHEVCYRRQRGMLCCYQTDQSDTTRTHRWKYITGPNADWLWVKALTLGCTTDQNVGSLSATTTTDAIEPFAYERYGPAPTATLNPTYLSQAAILKGINDGCHAEEITITREAYPSNDVRILSLACDECSGGEIDTSSDDVYIDKSLFRPSRDIDTDDYDNLALGIEYLRRRHKKILLSLCKVVTTTSTGWVDLCTGGAAGGANLLEWDVYPSVNRPETTNSAFTAYFYVATTDPVVAGGVRIVTSTGNHNVSVPAGAASWRPISGTVAKGSDTMSVQGYCTAGHTLTVESVIAFDTVEAA